jgi:hypothetical protein
MRIANEGLLQRRQLETYEILFRFGPLPRDEVDEKGYAEYGAEGVRTNPPWSRKLTELERMGVAFHVEGVHRGEDNYLWDVTSALPKALPKAMRFTKKQKHAALKVLLTLLGEREEPALEPLVEWLAEEVAKRSKKSDEKASSDKT